MGGGGLDDGAHDEGADAEFVEEVVPVDLDVAPRHLRSRGVARHLRQHRVHVLRLDLVPVQALLQIPQKGNQLNITTK